MSIKKPIPKEVAYWDQRFERAKQARQAFEEQWYLNMAFYFGKQYAQWERTGLVNRLVEPPVPRSRVRLISNKIRPAIRREVAKLCKEEAQFYVVPNSTEPDDVAGAKVAENLADYILDVGKFNSCRRRATFWASLVGTGYVKSYCPGADKNIIFEPPNPFSIYVPNIQEETFEGQPYIFHNQAVTVEKVWETYQTEVEPDVQALGATLEQRFFNALGIKSDTTAKDLVYLKEIWVQPCKDYSKGAMIVIGGNKVLYAYDAPVGNPEPQLELEYVPTSDKISQTDFPFEHGMYPFDKITHIPSGRFYGSSVIDDLIPLQKEYNRARSQITESKNRTAKPSMAYIKGSIEANKVTSEPGQMIPVNPGFEKPEYIKQPDYPNYAIMDQDRIVGDMNEITSQGDISRGAPPPGIEAASAIAFLQEENDDILYTTIASIEEAVASIGRKALALAQQFWTDQKMISIVSKNNQYETMLFKAADIRNNFDLRVEAQSMAPRSRAARQAFITGLMKDGLLSPEKGLRYLQMSETNRLYDEMQADSKHAQRENYLMKTSGQPMTVNEFDEHAIHAYEHALFMKSQEYDGLDQALKDNFLIHWRDHTLQGDQMALIDEYKGTPQEGVPA